MQSSATSRVRLFEPIESKRWMFFASTDLERKIRCDVEQGRLVEAIRRAVNDLLVALGVQLGESRSVR